MDRIAIIGLGLIGGSLGLALKRAGIGSVEIVGVDIERDAAMKARQRGAVDYTERMMERAVEEAALVIVATPIMTIREVFERIAPSLPEGCVVTDTGSTKEQVLRWADDILPAHINFVGGHPMAGKEFQGIENAEAGLFAERPYCIVPSATASKSAVEMISNLADTVKAVPYFVDAGEHDVLVAGISHLPLFLSAGLVSVATKSESWREMAKLASSGFRDVSRLASSDPSLGLGISLTNRDNLIRWLDGYQEVLSTYREMLMNGGDEVLAELEQVWEAREQWLLHLKEPPKDKVMEEIPTVGEAMEEFFFGRVGKWAKDRLGRSEESLGGGVPRGDDLTQRDDRIS